MKKTAVSLRIARFGSNEYYHYCHFLTHNGLTHLSCIGENVTRQLILQVHGFD